MADGAALPPLDWGDLVRRHWILVAGGLALMLPSLYSMARGPWSVESGVHGPIVLATGIWLIWGRIPEIRVHMKPGAGWITALALGLAVPLYAFGRAFDFISIEIAAMLLAFLAVAHAYFGLEVLKRLWFPIFYLGFLIPIPGWLLDVVTQPLKLLVSEAVTGGLAALGYPVGRQGVTIFVSTYQLLVEDACAGLNSLVSLSAIGLFYVYMLRGSNWRYSMLLLALVLPVAVGANMVRVAALVLITYYFGNAAAQGYLHNFAGMVTFVSALLLIFLVDMLLTPLRERLAPKQDQPA
jgi:exosortase